MIQISTFKLCINRQNNPFILRYMAAILKRSDGQTSVADPGCLSQVPDLVFRIRIHMFLGLPDPDPLVRGMDPDPSIIMQK
jgi:hypothetical protein